MIIDPNSMVHYIRFLERAHVRSVIVPLGVLLPHGFRCDENFCRRETNIVGTRARKCSRRIHNNLQVHTGIKQLWDIIITHKRFLSDRHRE